MAATTVNDKILKIANEEQISVTEATLIYCTDRSIPFHKIADSLSDELKALIEKEATSKNLLKK